MNTWPLLCKRRGCTASAMHAQGSNSADAGCPWKRCLKSRMSAFDLRNLRGGRTSTGKLWLQRSHVRRKAWPSSSDNKKDTLGERAQGVAHGINAPSLDPDARCRQQSEGVSANPHVPHVRSAACLGQDALKQIRSQQRQQSQPTLRRGSGQSHRGRFFARPSGRGTGRPKASKGDAFPFSSHLCLCRQTAFGRQNVKAILTSGRPAEPHLYSTRNWSP
jgi:hypothetical protein